MSLGEAVERLARYVIVRHLALELDAVCAVSGHGLPSFESPAHRSIAAVQPVHPQGRTPIRGQCWAPIDTLLESVNGSHTSACHIANVAPEHPRSSSRVFAPGAAATQVQKTNSGHCADRP